MIGFSHFKLAVVASKFNRFVTQKLWEGAYQTLHEHPLSPAHIETYWVPGSFEIPFMVQYLARQKKIHGIIALGAIIKGDTEHHHHLGRVVTQQLMHIQCDYNIPIGLGIITAETSRQARERAGGRQGNRGTDAARAVLNLLHQIHTLPHTN